MQLADGAGEKPTARAITERLVTIRKKAKNNGTGGNFGISGISSRGNAPRKPITTPRKQRGTTSQTTTPASKRKRTKDDGSDSEYEGGRSRGALSKEIADLKFEAPPKFKTETAQGLNLASGAVDDPFANHDTVRNTQYAPIQRQSDALGHNAHSNHQTFFAAHQAHHTSAGLYQHPHAYGNLDMHNYDGNGDVAHTRYHFDNTLSAYARIANAEDNIVAAYGQQGNVNAMWYPQAMPINEPFAGHSMSWPGHNGYAYVESSDMLVKPLAAHEIIPDYHMPEEHHYSSHHVHDHSLHNSQSEESLADFASEKVQSKVTKDIAEPYTRPQRECRMTAKAESSQHLDDLSDDASNENDAGESDVSAYQEEEESVI